MTKRNSNRSPATCARILLAASLVVGVAALAKDPPAASADVQALITRLGLHEAERPVSESKGWRKPKFVVARDPGDAARRDALQAAAPDAKVIFVSVERRCCGVERCCQRRRDHRLLHARDPAAGEAGAVDPNAQCRRRTLCWHSSRRRARLAGHEHAARGWPGDGRARDGDDVCAGARSACVHRAQGSGRWEREPAGRYTQCRWKERRCWSWASAESVSRWRSARTRSGCV